MSSSNNHNVSDVPHAFTVGKASVQIFPSQFAASQAAASKAAAILSAGISESGLVRIIVGTGLSQADMIDILARSTGLDWSRVEVFHMDEYVGLSRSHPASFRGWLESRLVELVHPKQVNYLNADAPDLTRECRRYGELLCAAPIDLCFLGFGENGHIAFNDPHVADFSDPLIVKRVTLDEKCRRQQVGEKNFDTLNLVPQEALTITCPVLLSAKYLICCVPERRKAEAVRDALEGPLSQSCPASIVRTHPQAFIFLDRNSASLLSRQVEN